MLVASIVKADKRLAIPIGVSVAARFQIANKVVEDGLLLIL